MAGVKFSDVESILQREAQKYIYEQSGKNFQNIHFINGNRLEFLINQVVIEYNQRTNSQYVFTVDTFTDICGKQSIPKLGSVIVNQPEGKILE